MPTPSKLTKNIFALGVLILIALGVDYAYFQFSSDTPPVSAQHEALSAHNQAPQGGDFTLQAATGNVSLTDFSGKWVIIYFGYTFCPDICPTNLANLSMAYQQLTKAEQDKVQLIMVSVDPKRDTPARLKEYTDYFNSDMIGLTGEKVELDRISRQYGAAYHIPEHEPDDAYYVVDHSGFSYVVNPAGKLVKQLPHATSVKEIVKTLRTNL